MSELQVYLTAVNQDLAVSLERDFVPFLQEAKEWSQKASQIKVKDATDEISMKLARESRLALRQIRLDADKKRKELKEDSLRYANAIQGMYNVIEGIVVPIENQLKEQEDFVKNQALRRLEEKRNQRMSELEPYKNFAMQGVDIGLLSDEDFQKMLAGAKFGFTQWDNEQKAKEQEAKKEQLRLSRNAELSMYGSVIDDFDFKTSDYSHLSESDFSTFLSISKVAFGEKERKAKEIEAENKRLIENQRLRDLEAKKQLEEYQKAIAEEQAKADKIKADAIAEANKLKALAETKRLEEAENAQRLLEAPDKEKIEHFVASVRAIELPAVSSKKAKQITTEIEKNLAILLRHIETEISTKL